MFGDSIGGGTSGLGGEGTIEQELCLSGNSGERAIKLADEKS